jgi:(S)-citramalyl-CoA lyase
MRRAAKGADAGQARVGGGNPAVRRIAAGQLRGYPFPRHHRIHSADASDRRESLLFGAVDMSADLRAEKTWETMLYARSRVVHAAARFGLDLLDVPYLNLDDQDGLEKEAVMSSALGFTGKASIHPKQIPVINGVFSPSAELVDRARRILAEFEKDETGLVVVDGELIERPVIRSMLRVLAIADHLEKSG